MYDAEKIVQEIKQALEVDNEVSIQIDRNRFRDAFSLKDHGAIRRRAQELAQIHGWEADTRVDVISFRLPGP